MTMNNTGGWQLTARDLSPAAAASQMDNGDGTYKSTLDNAGTARARVRCTTCAGTDNSMGSNFLLDWGSINQEFAAGKIGMYTSGSDIYTALVRDSASTRTSTG